MDMKVAFENVMLACAEFKGTKKQHDLLEQSLKMMHEKLFPQVEVVEEDKQE